MKKNKFARRMSSAREDNFDLKRIEMEDQLLNAILIDEVNWLNGLFPDQNLEECDFFEILKDGTLLCMLANKIQEYIISSGKSLAAEIATLVISYASRERCQKDRSGFCARENVEKFLNWCKTHKIPPSILFESNDCVESNRDGKREIIICLMQLARYFKIYNLPMPMLIQMEEEIQLETKHQEECIKRQSDDESNKSFSSRLSKESVPEINQEQESTVDDMKDNVCSMLNEGKVKILRQIYFVRILNGLVLIRVGGGWETLESKLIFTFQKYPDKIKNLHVSQSALNKFQAQNKINSGANIREAVIEVCIRVKEMFKNNVIETESNNSINKFSSARRISSSENVNSDKESVMAKAEDQKCTKIHQNDNIFKPNIQLEQIDEIDNIAASDEDLMRSENLKIVALKRAIPRYKKSKTDTGRVFRCESLKPIKNSMIPLLKAI